MNIDFSVNKTHVGQNPQANKYHSACAKSADLPKDGRQEYSKEQADAIAAQHIAANNLQNKCPIIKEDNINLGATCCGFANIKGNKRKLTDYRCVMSFDHFTKPCLQRNKNGDEKINGESTALVIPLKFGTSGWRGGDNVVILIDGNIPTKIMSELVTYLMQKGILVEDPQYKTISLNSTKPYEFLSNPRFKKVIVQFFEEKSKNNVTSENIEQNTEQCGAKREPIKIDTQDINIASVGYELNSDNSRPLADYRSAFLANNRQFTVLHEKYDDNGKSKDMTIILLPSKKDKWDCYTIAIDAKLTRDDCKNMVNYLFKNNINVSESSCKTAIVDYFNSNK